VVSITKFDVKKHILVPVHIKLTDKAKKELFDKYNIALRELPKMSKKDPAIEHLDAKEGDVIKIVRNNPILGESVFYRGVVNE
jgi:DNA-directed RNA polymerase subunit H